MKRFAIRLILSLLVAAPGFAPAAQAADSKSVATDASLIVGFPLDGDSSSEGVLVVPGTVIPYAGPARSAGPAKALNLDRESARSLATATLAAHLSSTFRLSRVEVAYRQSEELAVGEPRILPPPAATSSVRIEVELLGFNRRAATYQVRFLDGGSVLADSKVSAVRGERTVVGGLDGEDAPYLFLVLEPRKAATGSEPLRVTEGITAPRALHKEAPRYTAEAKEAKVTGVVIVQAVIDETGTVTDTEVLKGLPEGLSEAAVEAIEQWTFAPARDAQGKPVAVFYNLTVNFTLE